MPIQIECVRNMSGEVEFKVPLYRPLRQHMEQLKTHLETCRPAFVDVTYFRDGGMKATCCVATMAAGADRDSIMVAQKAIVAAAAEFFDDMEVVVNDRGVVH